MRRPLLLVVVMLGGCGGPAAPSTDPIVTADDARAALAALPHADPQLELQRMTQAKAVLDKERAAALAEVTTMERAFQGTQVAGELSGADQTDSAATALKAQAESKLEVLRRRVSERLEPDLAGVEKRLGEAAARLKMQTDQRAP